MPLQESPTQESVQHPSTVPSTLHSSSKAETHNTQQGPEANGHSSGATPGSCSSVGPSLQLLQALGPEDQLQLSRIAETHPVSELLVTSASMTMQELFLRLLDTRLL